MNYKSRAQEIAVNRSLRNKCIGDASGVLNETPQGDKRRDFMEHESGELSPERMASGSRRGD